MVGYEHNQSDVKNKSIPVRLTCSFCIQTCSLDFNFIGVRRAVKNDRLCLFAWSFPLGFSESCRGSSGAYFPSTQAHWWNPEGAVDSDQNFFMVQVEEDTPGVFFSLLSISPQSGE